MGQKITSIVFVAMMLSMTWANVPVASATSPPATSVSISTPYFGTIANNGFAFTSASPNIILNATTPANSTLYSTEYKLGVNGNVTLYQGPFYLNSSTSVIELKYRSNASSGLESWKSLTISIDADAPTFSAASIGQPVQRYVGNRSVLLTSNSVPLRIHCSDSLSGFESMYGQIHNLTFNSSNNSFDLLPQNYPSLVALNQTMAASVQCNDKVGNQNWFNFSFRIDSSPPQLTTLTAGYRNGMCTSANWTLSASSADSDSDSSVEALENGTWQAFAGPRSFPSGFNDTVRIRATDQMGLSSNISQWAVLIDDSGPVVNATLVNNQLIYTVEDDCQVSETLVRWETYDGNLSSWYQVTNGTGSVPSFLNGSIIRAHVQAEDELGNTASSMTQWAQTNGSLPFTLLYERSDIHGGFAAPDFSVLLAPQGVQSSATYILYQGNQSVSSGNVSGLTTINYNFSHGDNIRLYVVTTGAINTTSHFNHTWVVDGSNQQSVGIFTSGSYVNTTDLILGPTGVMQHTASLDDLSGVGADFVECTSTGIQWARSFGSPIQPQGTAGQSTNFILGCRAVDLLGNPGPTTWANGSLDFVKPTASISPSSSQRISPSTTLQIQGQDTVGVHLLRLEFTWSNGTTNLSQNYTQATSSWSTTVNQIFPQAPDGTVGLTVHVTDIVGNSQIVAGHNWQLNTTSPLSSVQLVNASGSFLPGTDSILRLSPPASGWAGVWMNYTFEFNGTTLFSGNSTGLTSLQPNFSVDGNALLNITTGDMLGRNQTQQWFFTVDTTNSATPLFSVEGMNVSNGSQIRLGPSSKIRISNVVDDSTGVGGATASCTFDRSTWFVVENGDLLGLPAFQSTSTNLLLECQNADLFGNVGPMANYSIFLDSEEPAHSLNPNGAYVTPYTPLNISSSDSSGIATNQLFLQWTDGSTTIYRNTTRGSAVWNTTVQSMFGTLSAGVVSASLTTIDSLGNIKTSQGYTWMLTTQQPIPSLSAGSGVYGTHIGQSGVAFTIGGSSDGAGTHTIDYTIRYSNGTIIAQGSTTSQTTASISDLEEGQVEITVAITDYYGRLQNRTWFYTVDGSVSPLPHYSILGYNRSVNSTNWLGPSSTISLSNRLDSPGGVGYQMTRCSWDGTNWFTASTTEGVSPISVNEQHVSYQLRCKNVDLLNNAGNHSWFNFSVDTISPVHSLSPSSQSVIAPTSTIGFSSYDALGISYTEMNLTWTNGVDSWQETKLIYTNNWTGSLQSLRSNFTDGTIDVELRTFDLLGNFNTTTSIEWNLNTTSPVTGVAVSGDVVGNYLGNNFSLTITPPAHGGLAAVSNITLVGMGGTVLSTQTNLTTVYSFTAANDLQNGTLVLNISTQDALGRTHHQVSQYIVDRTITTAPSMQFVGRTFTKNGDIFLGPSSGISLNSGGDDAGGVGIHSTSCSWDGSSWFNASSLGTLTPSNSYGSVEAFQLQCRGIDLLGNLGPIVWSNGSVDAEVPATNFGTPTGTLLSESTVLNSSCSDSIGCSLKSIVAKFTVGGTDSWHHRTLSGNSASHLLSGLITATSQGTVTFYVVAEDNVGNTANVSTSTYDYVHGVPTVSISFHSNHHLNYISSNLSFSILPSTGWLSGISVHLTATHLTNSTELINSTINQSTSSQSLVNLAEGQVRVALDICDQLSRCTQSVILLIVDRTGPSAPQIDIPDGYLLNNGSIVGRSVTLGTITSGLDGGSTTFETICSSALLNFTFTSNQSAVQFISLLNSTEWATLSCVSVDSVGNIGNQTNITLFRDDYKPELTLSAHPVDGVVTPSTAFNYSCFDEYSGKLTLSIRNEGITVYTTNSSGTLSSSFGNILPDTPYSSMQILVGCVDGVGNSNLSVIQSEWLPYLLPSNFSIISGQNSNVTFISGLSTITVDNPRQDVIHHLRYIESGQMSNWTLLSALTMDLDDLNFTFVDGEEIRIELRVSKSGTTLQNLTSTDPLRLDLSGPVIVLTNASSYGNSTLLGAQAIDAGIGHGIRYYWSFDNGTEFESTNANDIVFPSSPSQQVWFAIESSDFFGNRGNRSVTSLNRDFTPPQINLTQSTFGYIGQNSDFQISVYESTGLRSSNIFFESESGARYSLANNTSSLSFSTSDMPLWLLNESSLTLKIHAIANSQLVSSTSYILSVDQTKPELSIDFIASSNMSFNNTSNHSLVVFTGSPDIASICYKITTNSSNLPSECTLMVNRTLSLNRSQGAYLVYLFSSDFAGNSNQTIFTLIHHTQLPTISLTVSQMVGPSDTQNIVYSTEHNSILSLEWDGLLLAHSMGNFTIPSTDGTHELTMHVANDLGLMNSFNATIQVDALLPTLQIEGLQFSSMRAGTNTTLWFNSSDANSTIDQVRLNLTSGSESCEILMSPLLYIHSLNGTLTELFSNLNCSLLNGEAIPLTLTLEAKDHVGNHREISSDVMYHGSISPPDLNALRSNRTSSTIHIGPASSIECTPTIGAIYPSIELEWTGNTATIANNTLSNISSDGVLSCSITDAFGNIAQISKNLTYDFTPPSVNITWPDTRFGTYVRASGPSFTFDSFDAEASIFSMLYCISNQSCIPDVPSNGSTQFNGSSGVQYLTIFIENELGVTATNTTVFTLDNSPPSFAMNTKSNTTLFGSDLYIGLNSSIIELSVSDNYCLHSAILQSNQGSVSLPSNALTNHTVAPYSTFVRVTLIDCVGHSIITNYSVQTITTIQQGVPTVDVSHLGTAFFNGSNDFVFDGSVLLRASPQHPLPLNLSCQTSVGSIACSELQSTNQFLISLNASQNGTASIRYSDPVGNIAYKNFSFLADVEGPTCALEANGVKNGNTMFASSQFASEFRCHDLNEVSEVAWVSSSSTIMWVQLNGQWFAPPPPSSSVQLRAVDGLGNVAIDSLNVQFDDAAPALTYSNVTGVSFSEGYAKSDGFFVVTCADTLQSQCYITVEHFAASGLKIRTVNFTNQGPVSLQSNNGATELIKITTYDLVGNIYSQTETMTVDDQAPTYSISWTNPRGQIQLSMPFVPADGIIEIDVSNVFDVNISTSTVKVLCSGSPVPLVNDDLNTRSIDLSALYLEPCAEIDVETSIFDHAGNLRFMTKTLELDHIVPSAEMIFDDECSWFSGTKYDATPLCELEVQLTDDTMPSLLGSYQLNISSISGNKAKSISFSSTFSSQDLADFNSETVIITIIGTDKVGNQIASIPLEVSLRTDFYPKWFGVSCVGQSQCPLTGETKMTPGFNFESIGFSVRDGEAPIVKTNLNFTMGGVSTLPVTSPLFYTTYLDEGRWDVTGDFKDAAGRVFTIENLSIIYDTSFPILSIDTSRSTGYLVEAGSILSCDVCSLVFRVEDVTSMDIVINQDHVDDAGYYIIDTSTLSAGSIDVSVTDEFQRKTSISLPILTVNSTSFGTPGFTGNQDIKTFCLEEAGNLTQREVVCLWRREGVGLVDLPIPIMLYIDQPELREVRLIVRADDTTTSSVPVSNGANTLPNIPYYTSELRLSIDDSFSKAKPMRIRLIEHTEPWGEFDFVESQLNETDARSSFEFRFAPPAGQEQFYMIKGGNAGVDNWLECSSTYQFAEVDRSIPKSITQDNCEVELIRLRVDGTMLVKVAINHSSVRINSGLDYHVNPLFNLASFAVQFAYSDQLGVMERTDVSDLILSSDQILRAPDLPSRYDKGACQLGFDASINSIDGFLQSDATLSLNTCINSFEDSDGIEAIVWNLTFFDSIGVQSYSLDIECSGTYFPRSWAFQDAFNSGKCVHPGQPFPSGVYDVRVRPIVLDGSMYAEDGSLQLHYSPIIGNQTQCENQQPSCYVQLNLNSVTVYASFDPALEVENAAEFVRNWKANPGFNVIGWNIFFIILLMNFIRISRKKE